MTEGAVLDLFQRAAWLSIECAGPLLVAGIVVGLVMGVIQAATQLSEPALAFVPKLLALFASLIWFGGWILERLTSFESEVFRSIGQLP